VHTPQAYRTPIRLLGFAAILLLVFGLAVAAGSAVGPDREGAPDRMAGHGGEAEHAGPDPVRGLAVAAGGLELAVARTELPRGREAELAFRILNRGRPVRDFDVEHEKRMHVIVVRRDGRGFQHVHPQLGADGTWRVPVTLPDAGAYRVFADFSHDGEARTLAADLSVDGATDYVPLPEPATTAGTRDGYRVSLDAGDVRAGRDTELSFTVTRRGQRVRTEPYLGAGGHLVALREGDLAYLHVHPEEHGEAVAFTTAFPSEGRYRLYLQFKHGGAVRTAEFTQVVAR
jgi:hypothetical protein